MNNRLFLVIAVKFFIFSGLVAGFAEDAISCLGNLYLRPQNGQAFEKVAPGQTLAAGIISAPPDTLFPLATGSSLQIGSFSVILYPGATLRIEEKGMRLLGGRIKVSNENVAAESLRFIAAKYHAELYHGEYLLEVSPDGDHWLAALKKGEGWVKDRSRRLVEFQPGTEVQVPLFSETLVKERLSPRWEQPPQVAVLDDVAAVFSAAQPENEVASGSEDNIGAEVASASDDMSLTETASASENLADESEEAKEETEEAEKPGAAEAN